MPNPRLRCNPTRCRKPSFSATLRRPSQASMKRRDRTAQSVAMQLSRLGRISQADDRSADWRVRARRSKTFIVRRRAPKGPIARPLWFRALTWLRGLDLNQRPLGYEGKFGPHSNQDEPNETNGDEALLKGPVGPSWLISVGSLHSRFIGFDRC